jgi:hypothetical protein
MAHSKLFGSARPSLLALGSALGLAAVLLAGCASGTGEAEWPEAAKKWYDRAELAYRQGDIDDAVVASENALRALPHEPEVKLVAARIALARLEFDRVIQLTQGMTDSEARALRARANWYAGRVDQAGDELEALLADPEVRDPWAQQVAKLARSGRGRKPFEMSGGLLASLEMPRLGNTTLLVPVEVNGEPSLAMIATDMTEAVIDSSTGGDGAWLSLRFAERVEVSDVPAIGRDLSGLSKQLNAPIKLLIGVNLLRHLRATVDFAAGQFVVRSYEPPPPPQATTLHPGYIRGGAMVVPAHFGAGADAPQAALLVHTTMTYPIALDEAGWKKAGVDVKTMSAVPGQVGIKAGHLPLLRLGAFEIPQVPGVLGAPVDQLEQSLGIDLDGFAGSALIATFRMTFADQGKTVWLEDLPTEVLEQEARAAEARAAERRAAPPREPAPPSPAAPPAAAAPATAAPAPAPATAAPATPAPAKAPATKTPSANPGKP